MPSILKALGLHTFHNPLDEPQGALDEAENVVIDRDGVIQPRRGFFQYTNTLTNLSKQLINYKQRILVHYGTKLGFETSALNGTINDFNGSFTEVSAGRRIRAIESNGNLYFTTSAGVKKISAATASDFTTAAGFITQAGGIKALDLQVDINAATPGFFSPLSKIAYRVVWGKVDNNDNLILGSPSARAVAENKDSVNSVTTQLTFPVPDGITDTTFFYQVYRTGIFTALSLADLDNVDPGDEMNLVFEEFVTAANITAGTITVSDITPDDFRQNGTPLYTNPVSGSGIEQANEPPPFAKDIETYKGYTFYGNTSTVQGMTLALLSIVGFVSGTSKIFVFDGTTTRTYTFRGAIETYTADFTATTKANLDGNYFTLASANDETIYKVWFDNTGTTVEPSVPGTVAIKVDITATANVPADLAQRTLEVIDANSFDFNMTRLGAVLTIHNANNGNINTVVTETIGGGFTLSQDGLGDGEDPALNEVFLPRIPLTGENGPSASQQIDQAARSLIKVLNFDALGLVNAFYLSSFNDIPGEFLLQQKILTGTAFNVYASSLGVANNFNPVLGVQAVNQGKVVSTNEIRPNRIYYSKFQQPEAVPLVNFLDVGPKDQEIQRLIALRDSLFIFKDDGIYRLSGEVAPFSLTPFDFSLILSAPDTAVVLNNQVHCFTTQGAVQISDTGVSVISRNIEDQLLQIAREGFAYKTASFGVSYESDRAYLLFTVSLQTDTVATQCFRYNTFTNTWVKWDLTKTCGLVNRRDNKIYFGAGDLNIIEKERKELTRNDHADRQFDNQVVSDGVNGNHITLTVTSNVEIGDALIQTQYLTISQFNRLLKHLDLDTGVSDQDYFSTLGISQGVNLASSINALATKLDNDPGVAETDFLSSISGGSSFPAVQSDFNIIVTKLNLNPNVFFSDYDTSVGTIPYEAIVLAIDDSVGNTVILNYSFPFVQGAIIHYKAISTKVVYGPQTFGDPSLFKQVSEGTFIFENDNFTLGKISYKTDLSPGPESVNFQSAGPGDWGQFIWSQMNWGGIAAPIPVRTFIPRQKQRCRFIQPQFEHKVAFEKWGLLGVSLVARAYSSKAYK